MIELFKAKAVWLLQLVAAFLVPIKALIFLVGFFIFLDTCTGIWSAIKRKEKITSHKLSRVISKMVLYQVGLISLFFVDKYLLGEFLASFFSTEFLLTKLVALFYIGLEVMSINENTKAVLGVNMFALLKKMLLRAKEVKEDLVDITDVKARDETIGD